MSNPNPSDPTRNHPDKIASNNKVIVLSMKNMPSFKFDPSKNFLAGSSDSGQSVFNFKPQQLVPSASTPHQKVQVVQQSPTVSVHKIGSAGTILIRAPSSASGAKSQFTPLTSCPNVKIQEAPAGKTSVVSKEVSPSVPFATFRSKVSSEVTMKTQSGHTLLLHPSSAGKPPAVMAQPVQAAATVKGISFTPIPPALTSQFPRVTARLPAPQKVAAAKTVAKVPVASIKPMTIRAIGTDPPALSLQQHVLIQPKQPLVIPPASQAIARFNALTQKWTMSSTAFGPPVPALTLIQPKPKVVAKLPEASQSDEQTDEESQVREEFLDKSPEKPKRTSQEERLLEVKRIIEGDPDEMLADDDDSQVVEEPADEIESESEVQESSQEQSQEYADSSSSMLLCDEKIESVSTDVSPVDKDKEKDVPTTPTDDEKSRSVEMTSSIMEVRKNLDLELSQECDKENVDITMDEDSASEDSTLTEAHRQKMQDYEESLIQTEIAKSDRLTSSIPSLVEGKPKRIRKPKNPTIIATLGLPYKPSQPSTRKSKVEKKLEFELDFHDPLNKIQWDDGIGGLNNCNKLFGFDEFGLIEVINKKDARAKMKQFETTDYSRAKDDCGFKFRRLQDPADQFACVVCSKHGTIRDFFSPECCSEACLAITKRKGSELVGGTKESTPDSELTTPVDERKLMFGGEMIPLQQLQQHLLEQQLPEAKRKRKKKKKLQTADTRFQWDTYLTAKSVPAAIELFKNPYPRTPNPFKVGMKLEAIDPENQKLFCVCTVEEKLGYRIKLHFDGFSPAHDFWVNADSPNIFPSGFCQSTNRVLQTPPKWSNKKFDWSEYLDFTNSIGAQRAMFPRMNKTYENPLEVGQKLETMREGKIYAASIIDALENRVLIELDGHTELGYAWMDIYSPYLHPCNYHQTLADPENFIPPLRPFSWPKYLKETGSKEAPTKFLFFQKRMPYNFEPGLKLEVVDPVNRQLIRPATVLCREEYKVQVIFDGFDISFAYWLEDDSEDIHPINWCEKTAHPIEHPAGFNNSLDNGLCPTAGCRGIGNALHADRYFHDGLAECPYDNWSDLIMRKIPSRLEVKHVQRRTPKQTNVKKEASTNGTRNNSMKREIEDISMEEETSNDAAQAAPTKTNKRKVDVVEDQAKRYKVSKSFIEDYGPQQKYSFDLWKKNSSVLERATVDGDYTENPMKWSAFHVRDFVAKITDDNGVIAKFQEQQIDGAALVSMSQDDLTSILDIKLGTAIKIYNRILHLREEVVLKFMKL